VYIFIYASSDLAYISFQHQILNSCDVFHKLRKHLDDTVAIKVKERVEQNFHIGTSAYHISASNLITMSQEPIDTNEGGVESKGLTKFFLFNSKLLLSRCMPVLDMLTMRKLPTELRHDMRSVSSRKQSHESPKLYAARDEIPWATLRFN